jgi:ribonuclease P protein component
VAGFPRAARLLSSDDFRRVFERRLDSRGQYFTLHHLPGPRTDETGATPKSAGPRLGIVVPKKLLKTAVHRNLLKRLVRETFRQAAGRLPASDLIVRLARKIDPKKDVIDRRAIVADLASLLKRLIRAERPT